RREEAPALISREQRRTIIAERKFCNIAVTVIKVDPTNYSAACIGGFVSIRRTKITVCRIDKHLVKVGYRIFCSRINIGASKFELFIYQHRIYSMTVEGLIIIQEPIDLILPGTLRCIIHKRS